MGSTANPIGQASFSTVSFSYTPLLSDGDDVVSRSGAMAIGLGVHKRGEILKIDPTTGAVTVPVAATDANCILVNDVDTTGGAQAVTVYVSGKFKADALIWPGALPHSAVSDNLRNFSILVESVVYTDGTLVKSAPSQAEQANAEAAVAANLAASTSTTTTPAPGAAAAGSPSDSPWAYLTAEQRQNNPQLATPPTPTTTPAPTTSAAGTTSATTTTAAGTTTATTTPAPTTSV